MSVSNYKNPNCKYTYSKLKNVIYLVSKEHTKRVYIDASEAYIDNLSELPLRLNGFDISLNEESSLDERYEFQKTVTLSLNGYVNYKIFSDRYYVILESEDGTFWMVNPDFPARVTYTFNLSNNEYKTDFTFALLSNYPTLRLNATFEAVAPPCLGFNTYGVDSLQMIERDYVALDTENHTVYTYGNDFKDIEFLGTSCAYSSVYDGFNVTDTITFDIAFDAYKSSWHYNLLEFINNRYSAIVKPKSSENVFYVGFNFGLQPGFTVQTSDSNDGTDIITITLRETSSLGLTAENEWQQEQSTETRWVYTPKVGSVITYECVGRGKARYLAKREIMANGTATGNYQVMDGYEDEYEDKFNVVGTFNETRIFDTNACVFTECPMNTDIPLNIVFTSVTCYTYSLQSECDWTVTDVPSSITVSPSSGEANSAYTITVCNTTTPTSDESFTFNIESGDNVRVVNVLLTADNGFVRPSRVDIDCTAQNVTFAYSSPCGIRVLFISGLLTYQITNGNLIVNVPANKATSQRAFQITVQGCDGETQTLMIYQDKVYERWVEASGFLCDGNNSYKRMQRYTGTTSSDINTPTDEYTTGDLIMEDDSRCNTSSRKWVESQYFICIDGNKWSYEEEYVSYDDGVNWTPTGQMRPLALVEAASSFCEQERTYEWRLTDRWVCDEGGGTDYSDMYLTFESLEDGNIIYWRNGDGGFTKTISASTDNGSTWTSYTSSTGGTQIASLNTGGKVLLKGTNSAYGIDNSFSSTKQYNVYGNIMSLISGDTFENATELSGTYAFSNLFGDSTGLVSAEHLVLPATTLRYSCYKSMFWGCTSLTTAPKLPATTLAESCYENMFYGCTSLNSITCLATNISAFDSTYNWLYDVSPSGTFTKASSMSSWTTGESGIPTGWTIQNA